MKVLVTGVKGQLGFDVVRVLKEKNIEYLGVDIDELDITNQDQVNKVLKDYQPTVIIHCAAYTQVDLAEDNKDLVYKVNVLGTRYLAKVAKELSAKFVYISTDYVFDGKGDKPFSSNDKANPVNYYGLSKYEGELEVIKYLEEYFIVRISWVFGINGNNFIKTMLRLSKTNTSLNVVSDQIGSPTYTYDLAYEIEKLINTNYYGVYHITNDGFISWNEFAKEIFKQSNIDVEVNEILTKDYKTRAKRPLNSRMDGIKMRPYKEALKHYLEELNND